MKGSIMRRNDDNGLFSAFLTLFLIGGVILLFLYAVIIAHEKPALAVVVAIILVIRFIIKRMRRNGVD